MIVSHVAPGDGFAALVLEAFLNSVWLGGVLAAAAVCFFRLLPRANAATRHAIWLAILIAIAFLWLLSIAGAAIGRAGDRAVAPALTDSGRSVDESATLASQEAIVEAAQAAADDAASFDRRATLCPLILPAGRWAIVIAFGLVLSSAAFLARVGLGAVRLRRLASRCTPIDECIERRLPGWSSACREGRRARFCRSAEVSVPMLIGLGRPTVVVPAALLAELSDAELDHVALHELGHARRWDDWAKLAQKAAGALLFFHPAARWIERRMDVECEMACDEWVVATTGARRSYAASLVRLGDLTLAGRVPALAPGALARRTSLSRRIESLCTARRASRPGLSRPLFWTSVVALVAIMSWGATSPAFTVSSPAAPPTLERKPASVPASVRSVPSSPATDEILCAESVSAIARDDTRDENLDVRRIVLSALGARAGTVVVMDPRSGRVYTMVNQDWCVRRTFHPASMIKLVTAIAGLRAGAIDPAREVRVQTPRPARMNLTDAIAYSSTDYFQTAGERVGLDRFLACARELGLGQPTGVNLSGEIAGRVPSAEAANPKLLYGAGVGVEVTPIQLAALVSAIANGGSLLAPRRMSGEVERRRRRRVNVSMQARDLLVTGMTGAVEHGTAVSARDSSWPIAGKTGTWESDGVSTGLFASFAPAVDARVSVVVVTQGRLARGSTAAGIASRVYQGLKDLESIKEDQ